VRVVVAATSDVAIPTLNWLLNSNHELLRVVTTPDTLRGRGKTLTQSHIAQWALNNAQECIKPNTHDEMMDAFANTEIVITIAYGRILAEDILSIPKFGFLNLHFSLLPAYRGAAPVQRALQNGDSTTGITIFKIEKGLDTGPIYYQSEFTIPGEYDAQNLLSALSEMGAQAFDDVLKIVERGDLPLSQSNVGISVAPKITKAETKILWADHSNKVLNSVRAFSPNPGAWTTHNGEVLKILQARPGSVSEKLRPGEVHIADKKLFIGTGDSPLEILRVIPAGKKAMNAIDWINGARLISGDVFE
jgi:methionyl-tRNA formyltransferase